MYLIKRNVCFVFFSYGFFIILATSLKIFSIFYLMLKKNQKLIQRKNVLLNLMMYLLSLLLMIYLLLLVEMVVFYVCFFVSLKIKNVVLNFWNQMFFLIIWLSFNDNLFNEIVCVVTTNSRAYVLNMYH